MPQDTSALTKIEDLKAQIIKLREDAIRELRDKRNALAQEIAAVDAQLSELTGKAPERNSGEARPRTRRPSVTDEELKAKILAVMSEKGGTGMNSKQISGFVDQAPVRISTFLKDNPKVLKRQGKGPGTKYFLP